MIRRITGLVAFTILATGLHAQQDGKKVVDKLCGCFEVAFKYAETFAPDADYKFHDREEIGGTAELALPIEVTDKKNCDSTFTDRITHSDSKTLAGRMDL